MGKGNLARNFSLKAEKKFFKFQVSSLIPKIQNKILKICIFQLQNRKWIQWQIQAWGSSTKPILNPNYFIFIRKFRKIWADLSNQISPPQVWTP